jgi:predicted DNA-binding protein (MmcQ/YjbR family)
MDAKHLQRLSSPWPGVTSDVKWDDDLILSVGGKMFCGLCLRGREQGKLSFKVEPERFLEFTDRPGFRPAPYMARCHWVTLDDPRVVPKAELDVLLRRAYELTRAGLTKKLQREYEATETRAGAAPAEATATRKAAAKKTATERAPATKPAAKKVPAKKPAAGRPPASRKAAAKPPARRVRS